jgi:flagellar hook-length control protein FliK
LRILILSSLSTHAITASNNAAKLPAKSNADNKMADGSPFGVMLAATEAQQTKQPAPKPAADDEHHAAVKKSEPTNKDAPAVPKDHHDTVTAKNSDGKTAEPKSADTAQTKNHDAANDNGSADQTAQAQAQPQPALPPQVQPPAPQPDASMLAMAQASAAQPAVADASANDDANTDNGSDVGAVGKDTGKSSSPAASPAPDSGIAGVQAAAKDAVPQALSLPSSGNSKNPTVQAAGKSAASDSKAASTSDTSAKAAAQAADATQGQAPPAQTAAQTPPPAPATNAAAVPALNFGTPVQDSPPAALPGTVQVSSHAADTQATVNALAVTIAAKTQSGARQFDIRLDPPELGRVEVRLSIDASGKTEAHMTADQQDTLNLLQKDSSSLTQALRDAGLDVSNSGLNFSLRGQGQNDGQGGGDGFGRGPRTGLTASRVLDAAQGTTAAISFTGGMQDGRLDIHV